MTDSSEELKFCPFCSCSMHVSSNRDWHRLEGEHADECPLNGMELIEPATDDGLTALVDAWNTRHSIKEDLSPYDSISKAMSVKLINQAKEQERKRIKEELIAPTDSGVEELDNLCQQFNNGDIDLTSLVSRIWNTAISLEP